jgi:hypothetical protein
MGAPAQLQLDDAEPEPVQPLLLPEPPFWETGESWASRWAGFSTSQGEYPAHLGEKTSPATTTQLRLFV